MKNIARAFLFVIVLALPVAGQDKIRASTPLIVNSSDAGCFKIGIDIVWGERERQLYEIHKFVESLKADPDWIMILADTPCPIVPHRFLLVRSDAYTSEPIYFTADIRKNRRLMRKAIRGLIQVWEREKRFKY